jgi:hypothetical protein
MASNPYRAPFLQGRKEIDLRKEFSDLLYGSPQETKKGRYGLLRKMRRDSNNKPIRCICRDPVTNEPDRDTFCRYCWGHGYYWDEGWFVYYRNDQSFRMTEGYYKEFEGDVFYSEYFLQVNPEDYIITVKLDQDGNVIIPVERETSFKILKADPFRSDNGRIEFYGIRTIEERKWSTWYGAPART